MVNTQIGLICSWGVLNTLNDACFDEEIHV